MPNANLKNNNTWDELIKENVCEIKFDHNGPYLKDGKKFYAWIEIVTNSYRIKIKNIVIDEWMYLPKNIKSPELKIVMHKLWWLIAQRIFLFEEPINSIFSKEKYLNIEYNKLEIDFSDIQLPLSITTMIDIYTKYLSHVIIDWSHPLIKSDFCNKLALPEVDKGDIDMIMNYLIEEGYFRKQGEGLFFPTVKLRQGKIVNASKQVFIAMQFSQNDKRYDVIKRAIIKSGYVPLRADIISEPGIITEQIFKSIKESKAIICDLSDSNKGVYFEAGYAMAHNKKLIFIGKNSSEYHFDISHYRIIKFEKDTDDDLGEKLFQFL